MAACRSTTEQKTPRLRRRLVSLAKNPSTALSHDAELGVKWNVQRGCRVSHLRTCGCLWVEDNGMRGRIDVEANDVLELLGKLRVLRELETTNSVQRELVGLKDALHRPQADPRRPSQHPARPVGCFSRRRRKRQIDNWSCPCLTGHSAMVFGLG